MATPAGSSVPSPGILPPSIQDRTIGAIGGVVGGAVGNKVGAVAGEGLCWLGLSNAFGSHEDCVRFHATVGSLTGQVAGSVVAGTITGK